MGEFKSGKLGLVQKKVLGVYTTIAKLNKWGLNFAAASEDTTVFTETPSYYGTNTVTKINVSGSMEGFFNSTNDLSIAGIYDMRFIKVPGEPLTLQDAVINIQTDATLDPGATPAKGDRYILEDTADLNANFGTIAGVGDNDIVEFNGTEFVVIFDASAMADNDVVQNLNDYFNYKYTVALGWTQTTAMEYYDGQFQMSGINDSVDVNGIIKFSSSIVNSGPVYKNGSVVPYGDENIS